MKITRQKKTNISKTHIVYTRAKSQSDRQKDCTETSGLSPDPTGQSTTGGSPESRNCKPQALHLQLNFASRLSTAAAFTSQGEQNTGRSDAFPPHTRCSQSGVRGQTRPPQPATGFSKSRQPGRGRPRQACLSRGLPQAGPSASAAPRALLPRLSPAQPRSGGEGAGGGRRPGRYPAAGQDEGRAVAPPGPAATPAAGPASDVPLYSWRLLPAGAGGRQHRGRRLLPSEEAPHPPVARPQARQLPATMAPGAAGRGSSRAAAPGIPRSPARPSGPGRPPLRPPPIASHRSSSFARPAILLAPFVFLNHATASRSAQSQGAQSPTANGGGPRGFLNRPSPPMTAQRF